MRSEQEWFGIWVYTFLLVLSFWVNNSFYLSKTSYLLWSQKDTFLCLHKFQDNIIQVRISINLHLSFSQAAHDSNHINSYTNFCCNIWILLFFFYDIEFLIPPYPSPCPSLPIETSCLAWIKNAVPSPPRDLYFVYISSIFLKWEDGLKIQAV